MKVTYKAFVWTLLLAVPFTALALSGAAYITQNLTSILNWINTTSQTATLTGRGFLVEFSIRWPEVMGMVVGQIILLTILIFARRAGLMEEKASNE
jgi:hypothetical protein